MTGNKLIDEYVRHLPELSLDDVAERFSKPGVTHVVYLHDDWCRVLKEGGGIENCNCNPQVKFHAEPRRS